MRYEHCYIDRILLSQWIIHKRSADNILRKYAWIIRLYTNYMHSIVTTRRLLSLDETRATSRTTMGRRKVHLHTRGTNVVITTPPRRFFTVRSSSGVFSAFTSDQHGERDGRGKEKSSRRRVSESYAFHEDYPGDASNARFSSRGLLPPFYRSCPRNGQFNVQTPGV